LDTARQAETIPHPPVEQSGTVRLATRAEGLEGSVGREHASILYIPTKPVRIEGDGDEEVMKTVRLGLEMAGYKVSLQPSSALTAVPLLKCKVDHFWFDNYSWMFPYVATWGDIRLTLLVESTDGVRWTRSFSAHGTAARPYDGFNAAANEAMGAILREMVEAFGTDEFYEAVKTGANKPTAATTRPPATEPKPLNPAIVNRLQQLESLRREGLITSEEYERKRMEILNAL
jgi:hypothetical protein